VVEPGVDKGEEDEVEEIVDVLVKLSDEVVTPVDDKDVDVNEKGDVTEAEVDIEEVTDADVEADVIVDMLVTEAEPDDKDVPVLELVLILVNVDEVMTGVAEVDDKIGVLVLVLVGTAVEADEESDALVAIDTELAEELVVVVVKTDTTVVEVPPVDVGVETEEMVVVVSVVRPLDDAEAEVLLIPEDMELLKVLDVEDSCVTELVCDVAAVVLGRIDVETVDCEVVEYKVEVDTEELEELVPKTVLVEEYVLIEVGNRLELAAVEVVIAEVVEEEDAAAIEVSAEAGVIVVIVVAGLEVVLALVLVDVPDEVVLVDRLLVLTDEVDDSCVVKVACDAELVVLDKMDGEFVDCEIDEELVTIGDEVEVDVEVFEELVDKVVLVEE